MPGAALCSYRTGVGMKRQVLSIGLAVLMFLVGAPAAEASHSPETKAGVIQAAQRDGDTCARAVNSATSISHGIAHLSVHEILGGNCANGGPGCEEVWGYSGSDWARLGWCSQIYVVYPTTLPGKLVICHGAAYTLIRSGPGFNYPAIARVKVDTTVFTDRAKLSTPALNGVDGVAWYRIRWHGHCAWVASFRVTSVDNGCANWTAYWASMHHR